ncbi:lipid-A-disaccharide synthase [Tundrisphaera lichenicola]|uniref:lipid-A-disaccharide synthase n=1 Tax=Tundrisphaera lichenicola TaxID=2029860 RepID=UPI003EB785F4
MRIFLSTGEPSGDLHAANLIHSLRKIRPDVEVVGFGGPKMEAAGAKLLYPLVDLAVMWFVRVLLNINKFFKLLDDADREFIANRPDAVVLIDYPGFHWHLARRAKKHGIPVIYYVPPQIWAWAGWRVEKVRKFVDHLLCSLPFEPDWYRDRGIANAEYVGHPYFDELAERTLDESFMAEIEARSGPLLAILPGSRTQEVTRNLPIMLKAAARLAADHPETRFAVACLHNKHRELAVRLLEESGLGLEVEIHAARTPELIRVAEVAWAVSGSVGLELMVEALPTVVLYTIKPFDLWVARKFIKSKYISLVNLLADEEVMPEYLTPVDVSVELAEHAARWLDDPAERWKASSRLAELRDRVAVPGASDRAAERIVEVIAARTVSTEGQHPLHRGPHDPSKAGADAKLA